MILVNFWHCSTCSRRLSRCILDAWSLSVKRIFHALLDTCRDPRGICRENRGQLVSTSHLYTRIRKAQSAVNHAGIISPADVRRRLDRRRRRRRWRRRWRGSVGTPRGNQAFSTFICIKWWDWPRHVRNVGLADFPCEFHYSPAQLSPPLLARDRAAVLRFRIRKQQATVIKPDANGIESRNSRCKSLFSCRVRLSRIISAREAECLE